MLELLKKLTLFGLFLLFVVSYGFDDAIQSVCDNEESQVEQCSQQVLLIGRQRMPQSFTEIDLFCKNYKTHENCLRNHSLNCLSPSAHQTITILINSVDSQNQQICSNWRNKKRTINAAKCSNKRSLHLQQCLQQFIERIQGIHQLGQSEKIPVICCNYHKYRNCSSINLSDVAMNDLTSSGNTLCSPQAINTIEKLIDGYAGDIIKYVCHRYSIHSDQCGQVLSNSNNTDTDISTDHIDTNTEHRPQTFFSLLVKIYLS